MKALLATMVLLVGGTAAAGPKFSYDRHHPLALRLGAATTRDGVVRQPLTFDAGHGRKAGF
jgi:hypothetical protein